MARIIKKITPAAAPLPKRTRAAAYARVSCGKEEMLHSLGAQVSFYSGYIQNCPGWEYAGVYADEALTGTKDSRPEFQRLIADCRAGLIDVVITKSISRFARNTVTLLETVRELKDIGVDVYFEEQNIHTISAEGELMLTILASYAQEESRSASENCKWRIQKKFENGEPVGFYGMFGYDYKDGSITINEEQAAVVRQIFDWYIGDGSPAGGMGMTAIANRLNERNIPAYMGGRWHPSRIGFIIANEKFTGNSLLQKRFSDNHLTKRQIKNRGEKPQYFVEETHPAIISAEVFETAERMRRERTEHFNIKGTRPKLYPFSGMIRCERCGKNYRRKKAVGKFNWYCSTGNREGKAVCPAKQIPEATLMAATAAALGLTAFDEAVFKRRVKEIRVPEDGRLIFVFHDGGTSEQEWRHRSRRESWTEEMRQQARENALRGGGRNE